jgi:phage gp29-like protein
MPGLLDRAAQFLGRLATPARPAPRLEAATSTGSPAPVPDRDRQDTDLPEKPPEGTYGELPVFGVPPPDRAYEIDDALRSLEQGQFRDAALLVDSMTRDDRVSGCLEALTDAVLSSPVDVTPADDSSDAEDLADEVDDNWVKMFPLAETKQVLKWSTLIGVSLCEIKYLKRPGLWLPTIKKVWHPQFIQWRHSTRTYWVTTEQGPVEIIPGDPRWWLFTPGGYDRAWMTGKVRSLAKPWMIRQWTYRDWARWCEIHGHPIKLLITPAEADEKKKKVLASQLANMGSETTMAVPQGGEGNLWDVQLREATALGFEGFEMLLGKVDVSIAVDLLGQNLTTEVQGGSRAAADVHKEVRADVLSFVGMTLGESQREQVLVPYAKFNRGDTELAPTPAYEVVPPEDEDAKADVLVKLAQAVGPLAQAGVDVRAVLEDDFDLPMLDELPEGEPLPASRQPPAAPGAAPPEGAAPEGGPPEGGGAAVPPPPRPQAVHRARFSGRRGHAGHVRGQNYADRLAGKARGRAAGVMRADLKAILEDVKAATGPEDLRKRLVARYAKMNPKELADVVAKTKILASLSGRASLLEDA